MCQVTSTTTVYYWKHLKMRFFLVRKGCSCRRAVFFVLANILVIWPLRLFILIMETDCIEVSQKKYICMWKQNGCCGVESQWQWWWRPVVLCFVFLFKPDVSPPSTIVFLIFENNIYRIKGSQRCFIWFENKSTASDEYIPVKWCIVTSAPTSAPASFDLTL